MAKKTAPAGPGLVKTTLRIDFVEGLKPWIELRELLRAAGGKPDAEVQAGALVLEDQRKRSRVILQVRGLVIQDELPRSTRHSYRQMLATASKIDAASTFPRAALVRFDSIFIQPYKSTFVELKEAISAAFVRENDVTEGTTDFALIFDQREEEILRHTQIGPMQADQLQEQFLKWELDRKPDIFAFLGLDYERSVEMAFDVDDWTRIAAEAAAWQKTQCDTICRTIDGLEEQ